MHGNLGTMISAAQSNKDFNPFLRLPSHAHLFC